jgi:hypothetical protein
MCFLSSEIAGVRLNPARNSVLPGQSVNTGTQTHIEHIGACMQVCRRGKKIVTVLPHFRAVSSIGTCNFRLTWMGWLTCHHACCRLHDNSPHIISTLQNGPVTVVTADMAQILPLSGNCTPSVPRYIPQFLSVVFQ